jgi:hypothetical protein
MLGVSNCVKRVTSEIENEYMERRWQRLATALSALLVIAAGACASENRDWVLPDPALVSEWYGNGTEARMDGNVLEIQGSMDPEYLRRGGRLWARSGPYFYLFNVHVQELLREYPDIAAVRAVTSTPDGQEVARAMLHREQLSSVRWREALARASLAATEGTAHPRHVERLILFGEDHTQFEYTRDR